MAYRTGADIKAGDRFKLDGRWHDALGDAGPFVLADGQPYEGLRAVTVAPGTGNYGSDVVGVLAEVAYQLDGNGIPLTVYTGGETRYWEVAFTRRHGRSPGDYYVHLAGPGGKPGRKLGWVVTDPEGDGWAARALQDAFRGTGPDDPGNWQDKVPDYLVRAHGSSHERVGGGKTREDAAADLLYWLNDKHAPALGHGPHYDVTPYVSPWCPGSEQRWADDGDGSPVCPVCKIAPVADRCAKWPPRRRAAGKWDGRVTLHSKTEAARMAADR